MIAEEMGFSRRNTPRSGLISGKELVGHVNESITTGRYGKRLGPTALARIVHRMDFGIAHP
jgi:hypothetical protein